MGLTGASPDSPEPPFAAKVPAQATTSVSFGPGGAFGNVSVGSSLEQTITITNTGTAVLTVTQIAASGIGYTATGYTLPITLASNQSASVNVYFAPFAAGASPGSLSVTGNTAPAVSTISLSGTGIQSTIAATPTSVGFGNVTVGLPNSQTIQLQNTGNASFTISQAIVSGAGFSISGLSAPATMAAGSSITFTVAFSPASAGPVGGFISLINTSPNSPFTIPLSGIGVAPAYLLSANPSSLTFTNVAVGGSSSQNVTLTNNGNSSVTVSNFSISGAGFTATGVQAGLVIAAGQTVTLSVTFTPTSTATVPGNATITSNATNSPITISLSGTGTQTVSHSVSLTWSASTSTVVGYNVYRSSTSGGPYTLLTSAPVTGTSYTDTTVQAGATYFYVVTAVDSSGNESAYSNESPATVPTP